MSSEATAVAVLVVLVLLALLTPRFGADTRRSREWSSEGAVEFPVTRP